MPKYIDATRMLVEESEAYLSARSKITDGLTRKLNYVIHTQLQRLLSDAPAEDVEPVIHCKDCCYWETDDWATMGGAPEAPDGQKYARCRLHNYYDEASQSHFGWCPKENEFCSLAERKDGTHED